MSLTYIEQIRGTPYMPIKRMGKEFSMSNTTINRRLDGIRREIERGRYSPYSILDSGSILVNIYVFIDYLKYRKVLESETMRKHVPAFKPDEIMKICGYSQKIVQKEE